MTDPLPFPPPSNSTVGVPPPDRRNGDFVGTVIAWSLIGLCVAIIFTSNYVYPSTASTAPASTDSDSPPVSNFELLMQSRLSVGLHELNKLMEAQPSNGAAHKKASQNDIDSAERIRQFARSPEDKVVAAPVIAVLLGRKEGFEELKKVSVPEGKSGNGLKRDLHDMKNLLGQKPKELNDSEKDRLKHRLGWNGELALTFRLPESDPARQAVMQSAFRSIIILCVIVLIVVGVAILGLVLAILALLAWNKGRIRSAYADSPGPAFPISMPAVIGAPLLPPLPPMVPAISAQATSLAAEAFPSVVVRGAPFVEGFSIYLSGQILISLILHRFVRNPSLGMEWLLAPLILFAVFWPRLRGIEVNAWRRAIGWQKGQGAVKEVWSGLVGYVTGLPIFLTGAFITLLLVTLTKSTNPTHPIQFQLGGGFWSTIQIYLLACVWAPIVEETMFRGMLLHHLRRFGFGWRWIFSAALVSFIFAAIHPQGWAAIPALGALAMVLAGIREWRGSILGSMTAHCLQNFTAVSIMLLFMS